MSKRIMLGVVFGILVSTVAFLLLGFSFEPMPVVVVSNCTIDDELESIESKLDVLPDCKMSPEEYASIYFEISNQLSRELKPVDDCISEVHNINVVEYCEDPVFADIIKQPSRAGSYERDVYDCSDMTESLVESLNQIGFKASYQYVEIDCEKGDVFDCDKITSGNHAVVKLRGPQYIESVSGRIILPEEYKEYGII